MTTTHFTGPPADSERSLLAGYARAGAVPVGRRFLFSERRRSTLTVLGVAAALLMVLLLRGIFAGAVDRVTYYIRTSPAEVFVSQGGVKTMHMSSSALPANIVARVRALPGVAWVSPIGFASGSVAGPRGRQLSYLIGYESTSGRGGPNDLVAGRSPRIGEAVLDRQAAERIGVQLGESVSILGVRLRVVGYSTGGSSITNTTVFVNGAQFAAMRGGSGISYLLVAAAPEVPARTVVDRIGAAIPAVTVQTREQFSDSEARIVTDMSADLLRLMWMVGFLIALAVIAVGLMTATLNRIRDFAVLKALGARTRRLAAIVTVQVLWSVTLATGLAAALGQLMAWLVPLAAPAVQISITPGLLTQTALAALAVGLVAALWPLHRIATVDAATAFREVR